MCYYLNVHSRAKGLNRQLSVSPSPPHFKRINNAVISLNAVISNLNSEYRCSRLSRNVVYISTKLHFCLNVHGHENLKWYVVIPASFYNLIMELSELLSERTFPAAYTINKIQQDATVCRCFFTAKLLYIFRVSIAPIIRST